MMDVIQSSHNLRHKLNQNDAKTYSTSSGKAKQYTLQGLLFKHRGEQGVSPQSSRPVTRSGDRPFCTTFEVPKTHSHLFHAICRALKNLTEDERMHLTPGPTLLTILEPDHFSLKSTDRSPTCNSTLHPALGLTPSYPNRATNPLDAPDLNRCC